MKRFFCLIMIVAMILSAVPALAYEELAKGSKGDAVIELQNRLNELGYSVGTADGDYGGKTVRAIAEFQINNGLSMTGIANTETQDILFSDDAKEKSMISDKNNVIEEFMNATEAAGMNLQGAGYSTNKKPDYIGVVWNRNKNNSLQLMFYVGIGTQLFDATVWDADSDTVAYICTLLYKHSDCFDMLYCENFNAAAKGIDSSVFYKSSLNKKSYYKEDELIDFLFAVTDNAKEYSPSPILKVPFNFSPVSDSADNEETATTPVVETEYTQEECEALAIAYMKSHLATKLKNPSSLQVIDVTGGKTEGTEYLFAITISAMNSLGGYTTDTYYCKVDYITFEVTMGGMI